MKVAVLTDSGSAITQAQAKELGVTVIPMPYMIDGNEYEEGINLGREQFYELLEAGSSISTSQPSPEKVLSVWDETLKTYDQIVYTPLSSGLSSSYQTAAMLAEDYEGRVEVVDNQRISVTQRQSVLDAKRLTDAGWDARRIRELLERTRLESSIYITVDTLKYLKNGGRITPAAAALGTLLRIKPVLQIQGEKLDSYSKTRTMKQAKSIMSAAIERDLKTRFDDPEAERCWLAVVHTENEDLAREYAAELRAAYPRTGEIYIDQLSLNIACHIGPGCLAVACTKCLEEVKG